MTAKIDTWRSTMSRRETQALMTAADLEFEKGNDDKAFALIEKIPLAPELARCLAQAPGIGPDTLKASNLNLKDAEAEYGTDWLERIGS